MKSIIQSVLTLAFLLFSSLTFAKGVMVDDPYVRAIPPGLTISAAFMVLINESDKAIDLIKATSASAKNVELHEHVHEDGMMKMRQVSKITVAANGSTALKPGGYHIMLIGLVKHIQPNDIVTINLEFNDGSKQVIKADVKKIMMGMMKGKMSMKRGMKFKQHANPMPNLMAVFTMMGGQLGLTDEQKSKLDAGIAARSPKIKVLYTSIKKLEKEIYEATLQGQSLKKLDQLANKLMQARLALIKGKAGCRESAKEVLNEKQFQKMVALYRANMMPKPKKMNEVQAKEKLMKHVNPLPNLMQIVNKRADQLNLSQQQATDLKKWQNQHSPMAQKLAATIVTLEVELLEATLNNEPTAKIDQLADSIMKNRIKMIRGKTLCRNNMKRILDDKQYATVIDLYKKM